MNQTRRLHAKWSWAVVVALAVFLAQWPEAAATEGRNVFIHLKTGITQDDNQMCVAFNIAQAAVEAGDDLEMFFDAAAVFDLQNMPTQGGATSQPATNSGTPDTRPYNLRYELPDKLKEILSEQFDIPIDELPADYFGYLTMLRDGGATITYNGAMAHLVSLANSVKGGESITDIAEPLGLGEIVEHRALADAYFVY